MTKIDPFSQLLHRCANSGLNAEELTEEFEYDGTIHGQHHGWRISSATGNFTGAAHFLYPWDIEFALTTSFEQFRPIPGYEAMWSQGNGIIEAELVLRPQLLRNEHALTELMHYLGVTEQDNDLKKISIPLPTEHGAPSASLKFASPELLIWRTASPAVHLLEKDELVPCILLSARREADIPRISDSRFS